MSQADSASETFRPLVVLGTRPEAIKLCPVIEALSDRADVHVTVCSTGQHREMLDQVLNYFGVRPDIELSLMTPGQSLAGITAAAIDRLDTVLRENSYDAIVVQGDTTTVMAAAMVGFYHRRPIVHVEAGLRTGDLMAPWPEEFNRRVAGIVTTLHCAPTEAAATALRREGVADDDIRVTGNTVIDALAHAVANERGRDEHWRTIYPMVRPESPLVLITGHRRENFGDGLRAICSAIAETAERHPEATFLYPVHLNPNVQGPVHECLGPSANVHLLDPADYRAFVWLMDRADVVLTDSGGVQEEAPSLGAEILVTRDKTERPEAIDAGFAKLVGTDRARICEELDRSLQHAKTRGPKPSHSPLRENPYGDGKAALRIVDWMLQRLVPPQ